MMKKLQVSALILSLVLNRKATTCRGLSPCMQIAAQDWTTNLETFVWLWRIGMQAEENKILHFGEHPLHVSIQSGPNPNMVLEENTKCHSCAALFVATAIGLAKESTKIERAQMVVAHQSLDPLPYVQEVDLPLVSRKLPYQLQHLHHLHWIFNLLAQKVAEIPRPTVSLHLRNRVSSV